MRSASGLGGSTLFSVHLAWSVRLSVTVSEPKFHASAKVPSSLYQPEKSQFSLDGSAGLSIVLPGTMPVMEATSEPPLLLKATVKVVAAFGVAV